MKLERYEQVVEAVRREARADGVVLLIFRPDQPVEFVCIANTQRQLELASNFRRLAETIETAIAESPTKTLTPDSPAQGNLL